MRLTLHRPEFDFDVIGGPSTRPAPRPAPAPAPSEPATTTRPGAGEGK